MSAPDLPITTSFAHARDEDCAETIVDGCCTVCGVSHVEECSGCGGRGYHREDCGAAS